MSDTVEFAVEWARQIGSTAYVVAAALETGCDFTVGEGSTLNGASLHPCLQIPRAVDDEGNQRFDVFSFVLRDPADLSRFTAGQRVTLFTPG